MACELTDALCPVSQQGFVKSLLDVADNMGRALEAVPGAALAADGGIDKEQAVKLLKGLHEGVQATEKILLQVQRPCRHDSTCRTRDKGQQACSQGLGWPCVAHYGVCPAAKGPIVSLIANVTQLVRQCFCCVLKQHTWTLETLL